jgi:predicted acylesterase/phospholipase RssA
MPRRMAITIAGAVSLGSYEAGVLYELLEALRRHNTAAKTEDEKIYVDVITGASAGGMTAAMAAQRLLYDAASLSDAQNNVFYQAWVARINLWSLVRMKWKENIWHSLLSSDLIESLGREFLIEPLLERKRSGGKINDVHPALELKRDDHGNPLLDPDGNLIPQPLWLGLALTNLDGLSYGYPILQGRTEQFQYTRCVDQMTRNVAVTPAEAVELWGPLFDAAVASGAFPFAFRAQDIQRQRKEYRDSNLEGWPAKSKEDKTFTYTDGGVLQNQPIGLAKNLIDDHVVPDRLKQRDFTAFNDADSRLYVFVSPHSMQSEVSTGFTAANANFARMADEIVRTYTRQAEFHDWIMAEQLNQQVNELDVRAGQLADALTGKSQSLDVAALKTAATQRANLLTGSDSARQKEIDRLKTQYKKLYGEVSATGEDVAEAWVNSILTLEAAASLQTRDRMNILAVTANGRQELAGAGIASFAGFFSRKYREHDYTVGRNKARKYLAGPDVKNILGLTGMDVDLPNLPDTSGISNLPLPLWRILLEGKLPLLWFVGLRIIRWWPSAVAALILVVAFLGWLLGYRWP